MANKIKFQGLVAYNYALKLVKQDLEKNNITLKKGNRYGVANDCSFRDVVKKAWLKAKGKSKKSYKNIVSEVVQDCKKAIENNSKKTEVKGSGDIVKHLHYWELDSYIKFYVPDDEDVTIDNSVYGGIPDLDGPVKDVEQELSDVYFELNQLSDIRKWDSSSAPTYQFYYDAKNKKFSFRLQDNENRKEDLEERTGDWKERQIKNFERLSSEDIKGKTGGKEDKKDDKILEQEIRKKKLEVDKIQLDILEKKKQSLERTFDRYALMKDKKGMKSTLAKIDKIDDEILNL